MIARGTHHDACGSVALIGSGRTFHRLDREALDLHREVARQMPELYAVLPQSIDDGGRVGGKHVCVRTVDALRWLIVGEECHLVVLRFVRVLPASVFVLLSPVSPHRHGVCQRFHFRLQRHAVPWQRCAGGCIARIGTRQQRLDLGGARRQVVDALPHEFAAGDDPLFIRNISIRLDQDRQSAAHSHVFDTVTGFVAVGFPLRVIPIEVAVVERTDSLFLQALRHGGQQSVAKELPYGERRGRVMGHIVGQRIAMARTVRRMQVEEYVGIPRVDRTHQGLGFQSFKFDEVAIEVETLRVCAFPHTVGRADLARSIVLVHPIVRVGVVVRNAHQHHLLQPRMIWLSGQFPQQHQERLFTVALAGMNVPQQQHTQSRIARWGREITDRRLRRDHGR